MADGNGENTLLELEKQMSLEPHSKARGSTSILHSIKSKVIGLIMIVIILAMMYFTIRTIVSKHCVDNKLKIFVLTTMSGLLFVIYVKYVHKHLGLSSSISNHPFTGVYIKKLQVYQAENSQFEAIGRPNLNDGEEDQTKCKCTNDGK